MEKYNTLAIKNSDNLLFGHAPNPLKTKNGLIIGGGTVYPELNFTLPPMSIEKSTYSDIYNHYREIISGATTRAVELESPGLIVEFETLPPMCENPEIAIEITKILAEGLENARASHGLKTCLRVTPNDLREMSRPPQMRSGIMFDKMIETFEGVAKAGAELLSIESTGGKELHDEYLTYCDIKGVIFAQAILGVRDMTFLWNTIGSIAQKTGTIPAGDSACGFGNTAMVLAEKRYIPRTFAAVVRAISAVRALPAHECGAVGPGKDCAYENVYLKTITGYPMAMEGKSAACAHLSPIGNIASAYCDTWSNESVQNIKLLAAMAPTCYTEQLIYDCRLMNEATKNGVETTRVLRNLFVNSDASIDPQAFILSPDPVIGISNSIVSADTHYHAATNAARKAIELMLNAYQNGEVKIQERDAQYLDIMGDAIASLPNDENRFIDEMIMTVDKSKIRLEEYNL